jgi:hypothetical protein
MVDDFPAEKKTRRSRAELKELMIEGGTEVLRELGVETQLSSVSYAKVFEHLERTRGVRVTYGSVHERIWNSLQEYQLSVIERAGVWDHAAITDAGWVDWLQTMVALSSGEADDTVGDAARAGAQSTYRTRTDAHSPPEGDSTAPAGADLDDLAATLAVAMVDGLQLRTFLTGDDSAALTELAQAIIRDWADTQRG